MMESVRPAVPHLRDLLIIDLDVDKKWDIPPAEISVAPGYSQADLKVMAIGSDRRMLGLAIADWSRVANCNRLLYGPSCADQVAR